MIGEQTVTYLPSQRIGLSKWWQRDSKREDLSTGIFILARLPLLPRDGARGNVRSSMEGNIGPNACIRKRCRGDKGKFNPILKSDAGSILVFDENEGKSRRGLKH